MKKPHPILITYKNFKEKLAYSTVYATKEPIYMTENYKYSNKKFQHQI